MKVMNYQKYVKDLMNYNSIFAVKNEELEEDFLPFAA